MPGKCSLPLSLILSAPVEANFERQKLVFVLFFFVLAGSYERWKGKK